VVFGRFARRYAQRVRVIVTTLPGLGHLHPMIPLCRALSEAGHEVRVGISASYTDVARRAGLATTAVGPDWAFEEVDRFVPGFTTMQARDRMLMFTEITKRGMVDDLVELSGSWDAEVIVHGHYELGGWFAAELVGIPNVPFAMTVRWLEPGVLGMFAGAEVAELLDHFGLAPDPDLTRPARWLYLDAAPPALTATMFPPGPLVHQIRYGTDDGTGDETSLPDWVDALDDRPLVYVTTGTVFNRVGDVLGTLARGAASADLDVEVLLTTGWNVDPEDLGDLPGNVHVERYVPQSLILPRCSAVVCHGSANAVFGALRVGVPLVLAPVAADHPVNAWLCSQAGVGVSCTTFEPPGELFPIARADELTPEQIADALTTVLTTDAFSSAARGVAASIAAAPPPAHGVALIERLVETGAPVERDDG
jgi:UDP:flavonoid glycosyltransferase YjiC (YdhE family)